MSLVFVPAASREPRCRREGAAAGSGNLWAAGGGDRPPGPECRLRRQPFQGRPGVPLLDAFKGPGAGGLGELRPCPEAVRPGGGRGGDGAGIPGPVLEGRRSRLGARGCPSEVLRELSAEGQPGLERRLGFRTLAGGGGRLLPPGLLRLRPSHWIYPPRGKTLHPAPSRGLANGRALVSAPWTPAQPTTPALPAAGEPPHSQEKRRASAIPCPSSPANRNWELQCRRPRSPRPISAGGQLA